MFCLLFPILFLFSTASKPEQCLKLLCNPDDSDCSPCTGMSSEQLSIWRRYIDALLQTLNGEDGSFDYYRRIREEPNCCTISPGERCSINLIHEPKLPPNRFYDMECLRQTNFLKPISCSAGNLRCCNSSFCNLPLKEEFSKLIVEVPKDNTLIVILPIFIVIAVLILIGGWCFWRCRDKSDWRKSSQMPVSMVGGNCLGDGPGHGSPSDPRPWHMVECCGVGGPGNSIVTTVPTNGITTLDNGITAVTVSGGILTPMAATAINSNGGVGVGTTLIDTTGNPGRTPVLIPGGASISSSIVAIRPRGIGILPPGASSIGGGSTIVRGSEMMGMTGGGASYTATSVGTSLLPASCSAPPGAGGALDITSSGSGSGAGQPLLVERTVARQVTLSTRIGEGRYGEVWLGRLHGDQVAVKIFSSRNENSWIRWGEITLLFIVVMSHRWREELVVVDAIAAISTTSSTPAAAVGVLSSEKEIYETATLRHSNILGFIAADNKDNGISTELWLIAEYHRLGSLYEFLQIHAFTLPALIKMVSSIANGLAHLHMAIVGTSGKPPIAHRDLKSRNILVKSDGECCIGDLGFAVRYDSLTGRVDIGHNTERVGTKRYMAPEVLDNTLCANSFDAYMQADIYSLGLVLWEMTRRVYVPDLYGPEEYQLPYQDNVGPDPLIEEMKSVVCELGIRPHLPLVWQTDESLRLLYHIMTESLQPRRPTPGRLCVSLH
ncbi:hypothetical protein Aperf_G00000031920 [Anoplocephala perfoliata]